MWDGVREMLEMLIGILLGYWCSVFIASFILNVIVNSGVCK